jgi:hypothetical protein
MSPILGFKCSGDEVRRYMPKNRTSVVELLAGLCLFSTTHCSLLRLIVRSSLDVPTFATRRHHACHRARAPSSGRWNCGREMSGEFCLNADLHFTFKNYDMGPTALRPLRRKACWGISRPKNPDGLGRVRTKGQHATSRPPKPLISRLLTG